MSAWCMKQFSAGCMSGGHGYTLRLIQDPPGPPTPGPVPLGAVPPSSLEGRRIQGVWSPLLQPPVLTLSTATQVLVAELAQQAVVFLRVVELDTVLICGHSGAEGSEGLRLQPREPGGLDSSPSDLEMAGPQCWGPRTWRWYVSNPGTLSSPHLSDPWDPQAPGPRSAAHPGCNRSRP